MRGWAVAAATALLVVPGGTAAAAWSDVLATSGSSLATTSLTAPTLSCAETTGPLLANGATISWTPSSTPAALGYAATRVDNGAPLSVTGNSSVVLFPSLLGTLVGTTVTVRISATLPGTTWTTSSQRTVVVGLAGASVNCS